MWWIICEDENYLQTTSLACTQPSSEPPSRYSPEVGATRTVPPFLTKVANGSVAMYSWSLGPKSCSWTGGSGVSGGVGVGRTQENSAVSKKVKYFGTGTQKLEDVINKEFPNATTQEQVLEVHLFAYTYTIFFLHNLVLPLSLKNSSYWDLNFIIFSVQIWKFNVDYFF